MDHVYTIEKFITQKKKEKGKRVRESKNKSLEETKR